MRRIEVIKNRANTTALNQASWVQNYRSDVQFLLSRLKIAEEAIQRINKIAKESQEAKYYVNNYELITKVTDKALEQIQKEE